MPPRSRLRIDFPLVESVRDRLERDRLELERLRPPISKVATTHEVLRPDDLLHFHVGLANMTRGTGGRWFPSAGAPVGLLTFHFQPQHMFEYAVQETVVPPASVDTFLALPSRVVIEVPAGEGVDLTTAGLLEALARYDMRLSAAARGVGAAVMMPRLPIGAIAELIQPRTVEESARFGRLMRSLSARSSAMSTIVEDAVRSVRASGAAIELERANAALDALRRANDERLRVGRDGRPGIPGPDETSIEIPWRLLMSPTPGSRWTHRTSAPAPSSWNRFELWHTRLAVVDDRGHRDESPAATERQARAVWTRDRGYHGVFPDPALPAPKPYEGGAAGSSLRVALSRDERAKIVTATSDGTDPATRPVHVQRWMLTSQGGWIDLKGAWKNHRAAILGWEHRATLGRDQYVRVEIPGWLWPLGNAASLVKISERKLLPDGPDKAYLWQRSFIRVLEPYKQWQAATGRDERRKPFHSVEIRLRETPDVKLWRKGMVGGTASLGVDGNVAQMPFLGTTEPRAYRFPIAAVDRDDSVITFDMPLIFVPQQASTSSTPPATTQADLDGYEAFFDELKEDGNAQLRGQRVALAPSSHDDSRPGDARLETAWLRLSSVLEAGARPHSMPQLKRAAVVIEAMRALTGASGPVEVEHHDHYLDRGIGAGSSGNPAELFLKLPAAATTDFGKNTDKVGGFLSPELAMSALSRKQGPVAGTADKLNSGSGSFVPTDFFGATLASAKLFGTFSLASIIPSGTLASAPKFITQALDLVETVMAEVRRWQGIVEQIWAKVKGALTLLEGLAADVKDAIDAALATGSVEKALEKIVAYVWAHGGRDAVQTVATTIAPAIAGVVPTEFTLAAWSTFVDVVAKKAIDALAALVNALVVKVMGWVESLIASASAAVMAAVKPAIELLTQLWGAWLQARAMIETIAALPAIIGGDDPGAAVTTIGTLLGSVSTTFGGVVATLAPALNGVTDLAQNIRHEIETRIAQVQQLFADINAAFTKGLGPALRAFAMAQDLARNLTVKYSWTTPLSPLGVTSNGALFNPTGGLTLAGELRGKEVKGKPAGVDLMASIGKFELNLIAPLTFIALHFDHIRFDMKAGKKPEVDVKFDHFAFKGPLAFLENLRKVIPLDGFSDPPALSITPQGIDASFSLALPSVAVGVFSLSNLSLSAGFTVPFLGTVPLSVRFAFCSRENPFTLTVAMLGGGGFFGIRLNPQGLESMEAALEFGACLAIDLGVASGSVSIMAGVYFKMEGTAVTLTGYLRLRGVVDVLGLITASIELYMSLTYESATGKVIGRATLEVRVKVLFVSFGVTVAMEKRFAGSAGDPTFLEVMAPEPSVPAPWDEYLDAFAA